MKSYILPFILAELFSYANGQSVRLVGGTSASEGRVEVYYESYWGTICDDRFDDRDAAVVCNVLGYVDGTNKWNTYGPGPENIHIWLDELECVGNETSLDQCSHNQWGYHDCQHYEDVGVQCNNDVPVRLVDGTSNGGRFEVFHGGEWGTICNDRFNYKDANVICRYLGFTEGLGQITVFPEGSGQIWLDEVGCIGTEAGLHECTHNNWGVNDCGHDKDVGITCIEQIIRLANGGSNDQGRVEIFHNGKWGTICDDYFDDIDAFVVCKYLGFDNGVMQPNNPYGEGLDPIWLDDVGCTGTEESLTQCSHNGWGGHDYCSHWEDVGVQCNNYPTTNPTPSPTSYTLTPSIVPTLSPTNIPSNSPSSIPSFAPTKLPTSIPTMPSNTPTSYSNSPTSDSSSPTTFPTYPTSVPTPSPSLSPEQQLDVALPTAVPDFSSQEQHFESTHSTESRSSDNGQAEAANTQNLFTLWQYIIIGISFVCICIMILCTIYCIRKKKNRREKKPKAVVNSLSGASALTAGSVELAELDNSLAVTHEFQTPGDIENDILDAVIGGHGLTPGGNETNQLNHENMNSTHIQAINDNTDEDLSLQTVAQNEGQVKITKIESAVRLELNSIDNDNEHVTDNGYVNDEHKQENILLDSMLFDVLEMQDLDPNKIHQKNIENIKNNDTDSDDSDNMYEKSENEKSNLEQDNDMKNEDSLSCNAKQRKMSNGNNIKEETVTKGGDNVDNEQENALLDGMLSDILKMKSLDPNKIHQKNMNDIMNGENADTDSDDSDNMYE